MGGTLKNVVEMKNVFQNRRHLLSDQPKIKRKRKVDPDKARERASKAGKSSGAKKDSAWGQMMIKRRWEKRIPVDTNDTLS